MRSWLCLACALLATSATAATAYRVTFTGRQPAAHVLVDGARGCIDLDLPPGEAVWFDALITLDGGHSWTALNHQNNTWYPLDSRAPLGPGSRLLGLSPRQVPQDIQWTFNEEQGDLAPGTTRKYSGKLAYRIRENHDGYEVIIRYSATILVWTDENVDRALWLGPLPFLAQQALLDERMAPSSAAIKGFPKKITLSVTRVYEGGRPTNETITASVDAIETVDAPASRFKRPADFREQRPIIGAPGASP